MRTFFEEYSNKKIWVALYYLVLVLILSSWTDTSSSPNPIYKIAYLVVLLLPALIKAPDYIPCLIIGFSGVALYGYTSSYMPTYVPVYLGVLLISYLIFVKNKCFRLKSPNFVICFAVYAALIDLVNGYYVENITFSLLIISVLAKFLKCEISEKDISRASFGFAFTTFMLSLYFLVFKEQFTQDYYAQGSGLERTGWMDPNYFGMVLGMGTVSSMVLLSRIKELGFYEKLFYFATIALSVPVLVLNASRGAILAVAVSFAFMLLFSKTKLAYKIIVIAITFVFVFYLFNNSFFDLLAYRIVNDSGTGSGRIVIWQKKINAFLYSNPFSMLFGNGNIGGKELGMGKAVGSHNDYIAILCAYGIVGLLFFLYMLIYPIISIKRDATKKVLVWTVTIYIIMACVTLEPYVAGRLPFFFFYFYAILMTHASNNQRL